MKKLFTKPKRAEVFVFKRWGGKSYSLFRALKKQVHIGVLLAVYTTVSIPETVFAQTDSLKISMEFDLDEIEVSAQRAPVTFSQVARIVSVIERDEIEAAPVQSIQELLEYALGVDVRQRGVHGVQADVSVRGGSFDQTLILLNGINLSDPQTGHHNFNLPVSLKHISRIEILEGPAARVYGPNAFSGAINIITGEEREKFLKADLLAGQHKLRDLNISGNMQKGRYNQFVAVNSISSDGYIDNTDFESRNLFYQGQLKTSPAKLDVQLGHTRKGFGANSFYTPSYPDQYEAVKTTFASVRMETGKQLHFTPAVYWRRHQDRFELFRNNPASWYTTHNYHLTDVFGSNLNAWFSSKFGKTAFGAEFRSENIWSNVLGEAISGPIEVPGEDGHYFTKSHSRTYLSYFAEHSIYLQKFSISAGAMANWISDLDFDWNIYPGIDLAYQITDRVKVYSSFNTAMRMPTFTDLYYNGPANVGNPELKPEKSSALEGGIKFNSQAVHGHLNAFYRKGKDIIDWVRTSEELKWETQNLTEIYSTGIEIQVQVLPEKFFHQPFFMKKLNLNYSYIRLDKGENNFYSNYALDNLKHKFDITFCHSVWKQFGANWQISWQDRNGTYTRFENGSYTGEAEYAPFWLINLKLFWRNKNAEIYSVVSNLSDTEYNDIGNIRQPGRWISFGVSYQLNFK
ncbi:MAG: TonB-dependent receptor [Prolixibacteraceae bacterium]|jgi:iron complex outermembrane receptor protein|nr:TonB-dependent receptor [Prolixibacteraceae bacterium]